MRILVIHQNFPGQFGHLVKAWSQRPGWDVRALGPQRNSGEGPTVEGAPAKDGRAGHAALPSALPIEFNSNNRELLRLLSAGHSTKQIAALRNCSPATVRNQLSVLCQKLGVARRTDAIAKVIERNPSGGGIVMPKAAS